VFFLLFQWLIGSRLLLFKQAACFAYAGYWVLLGQRRPIDTLLSGFLMGVLMDWHYETNGIHTAATTLLAYLQPHALKLLTSSTGNDTESFERLTPNNIGMLPFFAYALSLLFIHHLVLFFIEAGGSGLSVWFILLRIGASALFTAVVVHLFGLMSGLKAS
jgi:hypothetical protein